MRVTAFGLAVVAAVAFADVLGGSLAAFSTAAAAFALAATLVRRRVATPRLPPLRPRGRWFRRFRREPDDALAFPGFLGAEALVNRALGSRRSYDHELRPQLFRLAATLLGQRLPTGVADEPVVREFFGEYLWPLVDPKLRSHADTPRIAASDLSAVLARIEELA